MVLIVVCFGSLGFNNESNNGGEVGAGQSETMGGLRVVVVAALLARSVGIKRPRGRPQRAKRRPPAPKGGDAPRRPLNCTFAAPTPAAGAARAATNARRSGLERADVAFDPLRTVQCGLERCAARWFDKVGTRATKKHLPLPAPPDAAELEFRLGGGIAYVFMPKVGSRRRRRGALFRRRNSW